ncbi:hypothetical protein Purlil1_9091 [Purpureocillium lilacinum]|uniref:Uncharacterized protein n=1 Tax=Purpureocillium lilacinum TaxID=33203 RepID=A0ABR0BR65_PURLI|nr:hypothetical protein Purlil1_9091 [Purpureocillium lilacinum]
MLGEEMRLGPGVVVVQNEASCKTRRRCRTGDEDLGWRVQIERADDESGHLTWPQLPVDATSQRHPQRQPLGAPLQTGHRQRVRSRNSDRGWDTAPFTGRAGAARPFHPPNSNCGRPLQSALAHLTLNLQEKGKCHTTEPPFTCPRRGFSTVYVLLAVMPSPSGARFLLSQGLDENQAPGRNANATGVVWMKRRELAVF